MGLYQSLVRPLAFQVDAEKAHETAMWFLQRGLLQAPVFSSPILEQSLFGVQFQNPLGLAAGFDKNAVALDHWHRLGFGFVECGTVTFHPQPGNPKPRLFRVPEDRALINRLGFNNDGARTVAGRLAQARAQIPVGVNLGKSRITELSQAADDYQSSFRILHPFGSYYVVNVSSPNTPGLRTLQEKGPLLAILEALREVDAKKPLLVKVSPDLTSEALDEVIEVAHSCRLTGLIATNTSISREGLRHDPGEQGGLSGAPLSRKSDQCLEHLRKSCDASMVLVGVGGICNGDDLYRKIRLGAHLCQVYTGWVYGGPEFVPKALQDLTRRMQRDGFKSLEQARGTATLADF